MKVQHSLILLSALALGSSPVLAQARVHKPDDRTPEEARKVEVKGAVPVAGDGGHNPQSPGGTPFEEGGGNSWFEATRKHLGTYYEEGEATGTFKFKNPNKEAKKITNLQGSCQCTKVIFRMGDRVYTLGNEPVNNAIHRITKNAKGEEEKERVTFISLNPEESGTIEVHMKMSGHQGDKDASVEVTTDDEKLPSSRLQFRATGAVYFNIDPPDVNLNELTWKDRREFTFMVSSPLKPEFKLVALEKSPPKTEVKFEKVEKDGKNSWRVSAAYGPNLQETDGGGEIVFGTDLNGKQVKMRFAALVRGPLKMEPTGFASFGSVRKGSEGKLQIHLWPTDDFELKVLKVEFEDLSVDPKFVEVRTNTKVPFKDPLTKEERKNVAEVELVISKDAPKSVIRGRVKITTNHPQVPLRDLQFNGFVR